MDQKAPWYFAVFSAVTGAGIYLHFLVKQLLSNLFPDFSCYYVYSTLLNQGYSLWDKGVSPLILKKISLLFSTLAAAGPNLNLHHSPVFYLLMAPFTWLDLKAASILWVILCQAFLGLAVWLSVKAAGRERDVFFLSSCAFITFLFRPLYVNAGLASVNYLSLFLAAAGMRYYLKGKQAHAGALLGVLAVTNELFFPMLLLPLFKRQWKMLWSSLAAVLVAHAAASVLFGLHVEASYWKYIFHSWANNSFPAQEKLVSVIQPKYALWLAAPIFACTATLLYRAVRRSRVAVREYALFLCACLILSPLVTEQHLLIMLLPLYACWDEVSRKALPRAAVLAMVSYLIMGMEYPSAVKAAGYLLLFYLMLTLTEERRLWKQ